MDNADHDYLVASTSLNHRLDGMDMWSIENIDMICSWLAHSIASLAVVHT